MARASAPLLLVAAAFAAVYVIWGSTYLAIRWGVETMPPFLMAGGRWIVAGAMLFAWRRLRGDPWPTLPQWRSAGVVGALLIVGGNGTVSWAEQVVPSALTALLIAIVPVWIALLEWARPSGTRPGLRVAAGIALGLAGVALLVAPELQAPTGEGALLGMLLILGASLSWAIGSLYSRRAPLPKSVLMGAAMEMLVGGAILTLLGLASGETARLDLGAVSLRSWLSVAFLVLFGSIVAYSAYVWLLQHVRPQLVATYAFVNPVVAVVLGVALAAETFSTLVLAAAGLVVAAVAIVVTAASPASEDQAESADSA